MSVRIERRGPVTTVLLHRPEVRNAVDPATADLLRQAFADFDADPDAAVAVLHGEGGTFCAGFDLKALAEGGTPKELDDFGPGPMGPTRMQLTKPVIASVSGYAVAGGLELALWCDLRVAEPDATFGVFCRRWGVPLIDGGTVRLPRLIGQSRALDLILTGRPVAAAEALDMGLINRISPPGRCRETAEELAADIARWPQRCLRSDRASALAQAGLDETDALRHEHAAGRDVIADPGFPDGVRRFVSGAGRHGSFADDADSPDAAR
jgi:enoyl-CoA hydratase